MLKSFYAAIYFLFLVKQFIISTAIIRSSGKLKHKAPTYPIIVDDIRLSSTDILELTCNDVIFLSTDISCIKSWSFFTNSLDSTSKHGQKTAWVIHVPVCCGLVIVGSDVDTVCTFSVVMSAVDIKSENIVDVEAVSVVDVESVSVVDVEAVSVVDVEAVSVVGVETVSVVDVEAVSVVDVETVSVVDVETVSVVADESWLEVVLLLSDVLDANVTSVVTA